MRRRALLASLLLSPLATPALLPLRPAQAQAQAHAQAPASVTVFAAASLQDAMRAQDAAWQARGGAPLRMSFASSSVLARQIEQGARADLFASADEAWMDHLQERGLVRPGTRASMLGNTLVLVAPADQPTPVEPAGIAARLGASGRLAVGDPAHVPAGRYAERALASLGLWDELRPRLARAENVRAALLLVERGEAPLGIVYGTDAAASGKVRVVGRFPPGSHPPISYPFALTRDAAPGAEALLAFLKGPEAAPAWRRAGFSLPE
ncbi:molybdate ABC transporter substrate-binding protein [Pseudoroseomonas rhizosphaerae]|uniref:Molybdate ABC transporter substrate-binding protein n=1 Tax=Teichococcus rhizosphaerae TaxID=1335062 RepID=A0A2C7A2K2_9PROT|nr:molybdate ABC transporter substrate-binding protein [Pseudoroseomonas rhizosphaerae]PHK94298.1 molybdate ABC transporter substrate-binding protein [Pseudoroseomonas rhizosphaerae]